MDHVDKCLEEVVCVQTCRQMFRGSVSDAHACRHIFRGGGVVYTCRQMFREVVWCTHVDKCLEEVGCGAHMKTNV